MEEETENSGDESQFLESVEQEPILERPATELMNVWYKREMTTVHKLFGNRMKLTGVAPLPGKYIFNYSYSHALGSAVSGVKFN